MMKENQNLEFKKSLAEMEEILETISAFANREGGKILVGIEENKDDLIVAGIEVKGRMIENLANEIKQNTDPVIFPYIEIKKMEGKDVLLIEIEESPFKPVFAKGKAFKRVGRTNLKLTTQEIRNLTKTSVGYNFTELICKEADMEDIDWDFVKEFFIPRYESVTKSKLLGNSKNLLESLGAIKNNKPTIAGILLFGKNPQRFFMNAYVALARYKEGIGTERLDYKEFNGNIFQQIDKANEYIEEHIAMMSRLHPRQVEREDIPEYGMFSIRELVTNAICHRDYSEQGSKVIIKMFSDRMEFYNPGGLAQDITPKNIAQKQFSRNPIIAKVLSKIKYIEELGEGWDKIINEHKEHPLKPELPKIDADKSSVLVILFSTKEKFEEKKEKISLNERQKNGLEFVRKEGRITRSDYEKINKISKRTAVRELNELVKLNIIKTVGKGPSQHYILR